MGLADTVASLTGFERSCSGQQLRAARGAVARAGAARRAARCNGRDLLVSPQLGGRPRLAHRARGRRKPAVRRLAGCRDRADRGRAGLADHRFAGRRVAGPATVARAREPERGQPRDRRSAAGHVADHGELRRRADGTRLPAGAPQAGRGAPEGRQRPGVARLAGDPARVGARDRDPARPRLGRRRGWRPAARSQPPRWCSRWRCWSSWRCRPRGRRRATTPPASRSRSRSPARSTRRHRGTWQSTSSFRAPETDR